MIPDAFRRAVAEPPLEARPEVRWWLAEGLHTDATLRREIDAAHRLGFGGMEFLAMDEGAVDHGRYGWGSEEWVHDSQVVVEELTRRGMAVSFTSGTNWSNANLPTIDPDSPAAAKELDVVTEDLEAGASRSGALPRIDLTAPVRHAGLPGERGTIREQALVAVVAARVTGERDGTPVLDVDSVVDVTPSVRDDALEWTAPDEGRWRLFVFWMHGTGQTASPSVSVNHTVNYLDPEGAEAVIDYWDTVVLTPELRARIARNPRVQMYMDSLELSTFGAANIFWGRTVAEEFRRRRGYDVTPWLPFLCRSVLLMASSTTYHSEPDDAHALDVRRVRFDYARTLTDLYIEHMLRPFAAFLHSRGMGLRSEISYGLPFELTRPGPEVDGIETESLEFGAQIDAYRLMAGPAHLFGKQYSSETGATTRNHMLDHRFYDQIIATQLAAGITKTVLHGWASPAGAEGVTEWPGHEGMWPLFSERFDTRQPASEFYPLWTRALGRLQHVLRQGRPRIDVGILRTDHFVDNMSGTAFLGEDGARMPDEEAYGTRWMRDRQNHWWPDLGLQDAGWTYEFLDGTLLLHEAVRFEDGVVQPDGPGYQALLVYQDALDPDVARKLLDEARRGLKVLLVDGTSELELLHERRYHRNQRAASRTQGLDGRDDELAATVAALLELPTVARVGDPGDALAALRALGVAGRAEFAEPDPTVLTHLREDGDLLHLYAYQYLYETDAPTTVRIALTGAGAAHRVDVHSGTVMPHPAATVEDGRTVVTLELRPGETALVVLDRGAAPSPSARFERTVAAEVGDWAITVESWDAGEDEVIEEDRGLGYVTREVRPTTAVTSIPVGEAELLPWRELPGVGPEVSGIGEYRTTLTLRDVPDCRLLLDLGSTAGGLGSVVVNDGEPLGFDTSAPVVDVTRRLSAGENRIVVRVASSLNNRLRARGYYDDLEDIIVSLMTGERTVHTTVVRDHGLLGPVRLLQERAVP
ncbi:MAG: glycosyl hydrolase [Amnibacterium sp.]